MNLSERIFIQRVHSLKTEIPFHYFFLKNFCKIKKGYYLIITSRQYIIFNRRETTLKFFLIPNEYYFLSYIIHHQKYECSEEIKKNFFLQNVFCKKQTYPNYQILKFFDGNLPFPSEIILCQCEIYCENKYIRWQGKNKLYKLAWDLNLYSTDNSLHLKDLINTHFSIEYIQQKRKKIYKDFILKCKKYVYSPYSKFFEEKKKIYANSFKKEYKPNFIMEYFNKNINKHTLYDIITYWRSISLVTVSNKIKIEIIVDELFKFYSKNKIICIKENIINTQKSKNKIYFIRIVDKKLYDKKKLCFRFF